MNYFRSGPVAIRPAMQYYPTDWRGSAQSPCPVFVGIVPFWILRRTIIRRYRHVINIPFAGIGAHANKNG